MNVCVTFPKEKRTREIQVEESKGIVVVRWFDNQTVDILSNYFRLDPLVEVRRWDKASKSYIQVERPAVIEEYSKFMGGIDLLDSFTSLYKQQIQSRGWYMYIFWHTIMISAVNSWLLYRKHCKLLQEGKTMSLYTIISYIASGRS